GGGNGVNLDDLYPKSRNTRKVGRVYITIGGEHRDYQKVHDGTYMDLTRGEYVTHPYRFISFLAPDRFGEQLQDNPAAVHLEMPDSVEGIWDTATAMTENQLAGRDVYVDLSSLRPEGAPVAGSGGSSSGPGSFSVEILENFSRWAHLGGAEHAGPVATLRYVFGPTLRAIRQAGVRRGAGMATLSATHPDLHDFITSKDLEREQAEGDISTFNISVLASDGFIRNATAGTEPEARILGDIAQHAWQTGEPGLIYVDRINQHNPLTATDGPIRSTNPCGEIPLYPGEPCDLGAINLSAHFTADGRFDEELLRQTTRSAVRFLDNVLTAEKSPLQEIHEAIQDKRRIGLGVMGLADTLIRLGVAYNSPEGREVISDMIGTIRDEALRASTQLGEVRGNPPAMSRAGLNRRNIAVLTVAPTGTTSMLAETSSGVEPVFAATYARRIGTEYHQVVHPLLKNLLQPSLDAGFDSELVRTDPGGRRHFDEDELVRLIGTHHGSIQPLIDEGLLPDTVQTRAFVVAHDIRPDDHVLMQATVQKAFDWDAEGRQTFAGNSISKTINLPNHAEVGDVLEAYKLGWNEQLKGITVYRDGSRQFQVLDAGSKTEAEEPAEAVAVQERETPGPSADAPYERSQRMYGMTDRVRLSDRDGHSRGFFITVNMNGHDDPREVFIVSGKAGDEANGDSEALGRVVSIALQHGVPPGALVKTLRGINGGMFGTYQGRIVTSKADLIAVALETASRDSGGTAGAAAAAGAAPAAASTGATAGSDTCPDCGGRMRMLEGCSTCEDPACGFSRCG
ncbi:MAG TPA: ribonucleoside-diphosphate reductase, adenosylcobalamin-dependent, partial [Deinococcales bacterium]|nr:ribonucleoside-diphosphate reductase, adenosylcobalamin-dependent [Deinococcales bacterium]